MSYKGRCKANYGNRSRGKSSFRAPRAKKSKSNLIKELSKYTTLTPEGRREFAKTIGIFKRKRGLNSFFY